jgi:hypothetical protein
LAIVQPLNGTGMPAMAHSLRCGIDYLQSRGSDQRVKNNRRSEVVAQKEIRKQFGGKLKQGWEPRCQERHALVGEVEGRRREAKGVWTIYETDTMNPRVRADQQRMEQWWSVLPWLVAPDAVARGRRILWKQERFQLNHRITPKPNLYKRRVLWSNTDRTPRDKGMTHG